MGSDLNGAIQRASRTFAGFTPGQKIVSVLAVAGLLLGGFFVARWAGQPTYAPLFANLSSEDAAAIVEELQADGTPYELSGGGTTVLVPREDVYDVRLRMSGQGLPSGDSDSGYALLDQQGLTTSQFQQQVAFRRALEGELTNTIEAIDGVDAAVVHLAIPEKDVFTKDADQPTASVLVDTTAGSQLASEQVQAIVNLVASSVEGLAPEKVTVADSGGVMLSASTEAGAGGGLADSRAKQTRAYEDRVSASLQDMLDRVVGPGGSVVRITADLDFDQTETTTRRTETTEQPPVSSSRTEESYTGSGAAVGGQLGGGILGPDNEPVAAGEGTPNEYSKVDETVNNPTSEILEQRKSAPGAVRKINVAVLLDTTTAGAVDPAQVEELVASAVGIDQARGDTIVVQRAPFDASAVEEASAELEEAKKAEVAAAKKQSFKSAGLAGLVFLVLLYAFVSGRRRRKKSPPALTDDERLQIEQLQQALELATSSKGELAGRPGGLKPALEPAPVDPRAEQVRAARQEISELVQQQPDEVAQLLRSWLADRRA